MKIKAIYPDIFEGSKKVKAFFTLKNEHVTGNERLIRGLNLGFNTNEAPEIVKTNRRILIKEFNLASNWIAFANQVHSNRVKVVANGGTYADTDALITQVPGLALAIQVADCAAVLVADEKAGIVAAIHAGWRGAAGDIVPRSIQKMIDLGSIPSHCRVFVSPCISQSEFEVGKEVANQFPVQFVNFEENEKPHINLKAFLQSQLIESGIKPENIQCMTAAPCRMINSIRTEEKERRVGG